MLVHRIILTTKKQPKQKTQIMKNIIKTIKEKVILFSFCVNLLLCFTSCAYFSAAESKMREYRELQRDAADILNTPSLFSDLDINDLHKAVDQELKQIEKDNKRKKPPVLAKATI
jgi:hypothetical protein